MHVVNIHNQQLLLVQTDPDMQYRYTGTNAHGIITDCCSGTIENIKIENVQWLYGTATG